MALKLFAGAKGSKTYPHAKDLMDFGRRVCGVSDPAAVIQRIARGMVQALAKCRTDQRIAKPLHDQMNAAWQSGLLLARELARGG